MNGDLSQKRYEAGTPPRVAIQGLGRSGTSWLMKIFDHHPAVHALYEPENLLPRSALGPSPDTAAYVRYCEALFACRGHRAVRSRPILPKIHRTPPAHWARLAVIYGLALLMRAAPALKSSIGRTPVPDFADLSSSPRVVKLVSALDATEGLVASNPSVRFVFIIRHPCGQILSNSRGVEIGKMRPGLFLPPRRLMDRLYAFEGGAASLREADFTQLELYAYRWAAWNDMFVRLAETHENARVLVYEDLCARPTAAARELFAWTGVDWRPEVEAFLRAVETAEGDAEGYHDLRRNPLTAANRWRKTITQDDYRMIANICRPSAAARLFPELASGITEASPVATAS
jgi:hypothetical protein